MKIEFIKEKNEITGYKLIPETTDEKYDINKVRNMYFMRKVRYDGREKGCSKFAGNLKFKVENL
jgi:hypothetical protein